MWQHR